MPKIGIGLIDCKLDTPYPTFHSSNKIADKNKLLKELSVFDYAFLINKGIKIKDPLTFEHFTITSEKTGHQALTSGTSEVSNEKPIYDRDPYVDYWQYPGTQFLMLTKRAINEAGNMDEKFPENTWEDVEYTHRLCMKGLIPPFGLFVGIKNEPFYFEMDKEVLKERMTLTKEVKEKLNKATMYWQSKNPESFPRMGGKDRIIGEKKIELKKSEGMI